MTTTEEKQQKQQDSDESKDDDESSCSPFEISDNEITNGKFVLLLGIVDIPKKYVKSLYGAIHGIASICSLLLGNYLFLFYVVFGIIKEEQNDDNTIMKIIFYISTLISALVVVVFYWNKVQSWQLSTTTMKQKGLTSQILQNLNRGRTIGGLICHSIYPIVCYVFPTKYLQDQAFSSGIAILLLTLCIYSYMLIKDYGKAIYVVYGAYTVGLSLSILQFETIEKLNSNYPTIIDHTDKMAYMVISCVQYGFCLYYLYSRRLVSKDTVQQLCKNYHPIIILIWFIRLQVDKWWKTLPVCMLKVPSILTLLFTLFLFKIIKKSKSFFLLPSKKTMMKKKTAVDEGTHQTQTPPLSSPPPPEKRENEQQSINNNHNETTATATATTAQRPQRRRRSSIFEVTSQSSKRRSSLLESIDVGLFEDLADY